MFGLSTLTMKLIIGGIVLVVVLATFYGWRSSLIDQGYQKGVDEYAPQLANLKGQLVYWKISHKQWEESYKNLVKATDEQNAALERMNSETLTRYENTKKTSAKLSVEVSKQRNTAEELAQRLETMEVSNEECTALRQLISTTRRHGM